MGRHQQDLVVEMKWHSIMAILSHFSMRLDKQYRKCLKNILKKETYCLC